MQVGMVKNTIGLVVAAGLLEYFFLFNFAICDFLILFIF